MTPDRLNELMAASGMPYCQSVREAIRAAYADGVASRSSGDAEIAHGAAVLADSKAWLDGFHAAKAGKTDDDNPYAFQVLRSAWSAGFASARAVEEICGE